MKEKAAYIQERTRHLLWVYRYDVIAISFMLIFIGLYLLPIYGNGHVVFSDLAFGFSSDRYMTEIFGGWNERWSTSTLFNVPRLVYILPLFLLSLVFGGSRPLLIKGFITVLLVLSAVTMYLFIKRVISIYFTRHFTFYMIMGLTVGSLFYALNPWVLFRVQHIYLLCGYSLFPLVIMLFFNLFDPKFQAQLIPGYDITKKWIYKRNVIDAFLLALTFSVAAAAIHYFFFGAIYLGIIGLLLLGKAYWKHRSGRFHVWKRITIHFLSRVFLVGVLFFFFSFYWLSMYGGSILLDAQASQHNINVVDTLSLFSRNSSFVNVLYFVSYWWPMFSLEELPWTFYAAGGFLFLFILFAMLTRAYRNAIILYLSFLSLIFLIGATGVYYSWFAEFFVLLVTKTPVIGSIFRDPNKFIGLLAVNFSVFLSVGLIQWFQFMKIQEGRKSYLVQLSSLVLVIIALVYYADPMRHYFVEGYYAPVEEPEEYAQLEDELIHPDSFDSRVLYLPLADQMTQPYAGIATPYWNDTSREGALEKATGDVHVYSSPKNTLFHHEGNKKSITQALNYYQSLMDEGRSSNLASLYSTFGINELAYHTEYKSQEQRQAFNEEMLAEQEGMKAHHEGEIFTLYELKKNLQLPYLYEVPSRIYTPYGVSRLESYHGLESFNFRDYGVLFTSLNRDSHLKEATSEDYVEVNKKEDLLLSEISEEHYLYPFDAIDQSNAFLKWGKTLVENSEWNWFLQSQDIRDDSRDFAYDTGVGVTFASAELDVLPYEKDQIEGNLIEDFDSLLQNDIFFTPDNPELFEVQATPTNEYNELPVVSGDVTAADPNNIWQVAKSGMIETEENMPYTFNLLMSGREVDNLHLKARFYDEDGEEIGVSYVVSPEGQESFDALNFTGEYVSPPGTEKMRIDLLTYQQPDAKTFWWIHDVEIHSYEEYTRENTFTMNKEIETSGDYDLYMRSFHSETGGEVRVGLNGKETIVSTESSLNQFQWTKIDDYTLQNGSYDIDVTNMSGFNALNLFALVPDEELKETGNHLVETLKAPNVFMNLEAERDFEVYGHVQTRRSFPELSNGKGISIADGKLTKEVDILKPGTYALSLSANAIPAQNGEVTVSLKPDDSEKETITHTFQSDSFTATDDGRDTVIDYMQFNEHPYIHRELDGYYDNLKTLTTPGMELDTGAYTLEINIDSRAPEVSTLDDLHKFDPNEVNIEEEIPDPYNDDCTDCLSIDPSMYSDDKDEEGMDISYDPTCSCDWYVYASRKIEVEAFEELLIRARARSEEVIKRHMKVFFLDEEDRIIDTTFIQDIEEEDKDEWNDYEQIVQAPEEAERMQFHIWARGNDEEQGSLQLEDYSIVRYSDLTLIDQLFLYEGTSTDAFLPDRKEMDTVSWNRIDSMKRTFTLDNEDNESTTMLYRESPNPLWEMKLGEDQLRGTTVINGVSTAFVTDQSGEGSITVVLRLIYYGGLLLFPLGFLFAFLIYRRL
ncbi:hypothetical protein U0355_02075 [Salimicrobium sp. PL1-032A]|uniref:hypothetical protein n=1 Tax=Salimicrobium sp. PL1-032A TaxID=3095364 RepID=UPI0032618B25